MCSYYFYTLDLKFGKTKNSYIRFVIGWLEMKEKPLYFMGGLNSAA